MTQINAYIGFNGKCREAMNFYRKCFGGELTIMTMGESPMAEQMPAESHDTILHCSLSNGAVMLMGTDMTGPQGFVPGNTVSLMIRCSSEEEINRLFEKLCEGGEVTCPLGKQFWGSTFAALGDKFGTSWMLEYSEAPCT
jgi:PhnB protein